MRIPRMQQNTRRAPRVQDGSGENSFTDVRTWFRHFLLTCSQARTWDGSADKGSTLVP